MFFDLEIGQIPNVVWAAICDDPRLAPYRHYLDHERHMAVHNLSEPEEKILVETANARGRAFARMATEINSRTRFRIEVDGEWSRRANPRSWCCSTTMTAICDVVPPNR